MKAHYDEKKINVYKDQSSPLLSPLISRGYLESETSKKIERKAFSRKLSFNREKPIRPASNSLSLPKERTIFTSSSNYRFTENLKTINKLEGLLSEPQLDLHELSLKVSQKAKKPEFEDFGFITQRIDDNKEDPSEPIFIRPETENRCFFRKYSFIYFHVAIKDKESPLKASFYIEEGEKNSKFKIYASTKNRSPNKFNADFEIEVSIFKDLNFIYIYGYIFSYLGQKLPLFGP